MTIKFKVGSNDCVFFDDNRKIVNGDELISTVTFPKSGINKLVLKVDDTNYCFVNTVSGDKYMQSIYNDVMIPLTESTDPKSSTVESVLVHTNSVMGLGEPVGATGGKLWYEDGSSESGVKYWYIDIHGNKIYCTEEEDSKLDAAKQALA